MPSSQEGHWTYTIDEWLRHPFTQITDNLPKDVKVIYDVGANVGGWSFLMKQRYPDAQFFCFEPVFENYDVLLKKVFPWAVCLPYGIFYGERKSRVLSRGDHNVGAYFVEHIISGEPRIDEGEVMHLRPFEELPIPKADLMKFDVEGSEENIFEHSSMVKSTPWLVVEWHPNTNPYEFFKTHLPDHEIVVDITRAQFLLKLKSI